VLFVLCFHYHGGKDEEEATEETPAPAAEEA
jgi:hypothetical protein